MCRLTKSARRAERDRTAILFAIGVEQIAKDFARSALRFRTSRNTPTRLPTNGPPLRLCHEKKGA